MTRTIPPSTTPSNAPAASSSTQPALRLSDLVAASGVAFGTSGARGKVVDMTPALCQAYTRAFVASVVPQARAVVLGHDLRPSSPAIAAACADALTQCGLRVVYGGALPTPALAYYAAQHGLPALIVTGSHIPFDRNGIKFYKEDGEISKADEQAMLACPLPSSQPEPSGAAQPAPLSTPLSTPLPAPEPAVLHAYHQRYLQFFGPQALQGQTVAVYEHSSVARDVLRPLLQALGARVLSLGRTDTFVPIDTEAVRPEDIAQARQWAAQHRFDAIVSTDGDADRPLIGDENGHWLRGDVVGILCAQYLHASAVVTPVNSNTALERCGAFAQIVRTRIGSPYVIEGMQQAAAQGAQRVVGFEANGGFLLGSALTASTSDAPASSERAPASTQDATGTAPSATTPATLAALPTRDAVLPMLALLCEARSRGLPLSALAARLPERATASDRIQDIATAHSQALIARLRDDPQALAALLAPYSGALDRLDHTDGLRAHFANGDIVHLRPSGNAPELRCYAESSHIEQAQHLCAAALRAVHASLD